MFAGRVEKMGKRKRNATQEEEELGSLGGDAEKDEAVVQQESAIPLTIQIIIGTYEKVLHGITASIRSQANKNLEQNCVEFADSFLLNAHTSAIRCLAVRRALSSLIQIIRLQDLLPEERCLAKFARLLCSSSYR